jgi:hypothetical protein
MSQTQTQIQINSQTLNQIPKSIQVLKIPRVYNIIRSIIESSTKAEYLHNQPIKVSENVVKFVKYRNVRRIWTVVVEKFSSEEGEGYRVEVLEAPVTLTVYKVKVQQNERGYLLPAKMWLSWRWMGTGLLMSTNSKQRT